MSNLKCYNCGSDVVIGENPHIGICTRCFAEVPVPKEDRSIMQAYSYANELLSERRFEEAREAFRDILIRVPQEAAACWGYAVSEYGIEFVQDPDTAEQIPTLHRLSREQFSKFHYVKQAIDYAPDYESEKFYREKSAQIDLIQSRSLQISGKEDPYDVFICYKKTEEGEKRTSDARIAADLYRELIRRGYKVFFAEETLGVGEEYEPRIFAALQSARVMLAIGSRQEYYNAVWVKNEWSRYAQLLRTEPGSGRLLIPVFYNLSHDAIPAVLREQPQYCDLSAADDPKQVLFGMISAHFSGENRDEVSDLQRQVRGKGTGAIRMETSADNYFTRGTVELVNGNFDVAESMFRQSLELQESPDAYLGLMMCAMKIPGPEALHQYADPIARQPMFKKALACASEQKQEELFKIAETCEENRKWRLKCAEEHEKCCADAVNAMKTVEKFSLQTPAHQKCAAALNFTERAEVTVSKLKKQSSFTKIFRIFLLLGNVFPAVSMVASELGEMAGIDTTIDWIAMPGTLSMVICYLVCCFIMLKEIPFLEEGFFALLIRVAVGYVSSMLIIQAMQSMKAKLTFLLIAVVAYALFYIFVDLRRKPAKVRAAKCRKQAAEVLASLASLDAALQSETLLQLRRVTEPYRQYYSAAYWQDLQNRFAADLKAMCEGSLAKLRDRLTVIADRKAGEK